MGRERRGGGTGTRDAPAGTGGMEGRGPDPVPGARLSLPAPGERVAQQRESAWENLAPGVFPIPEAPRCQRSRSTFATRGSSRGGCSGPGEAWRQAGMRGLDAWRSASWRALAAAFPGAWGRNATARVLPDSLPALAFLLPSSWCSISSVLRSPTLFQG